MVTRPKTWCLLPLCGSRPSSRCSIFSGACGAAEAMRTEATSRLSRLHPHTRSQAIEMFPGKG